MQTSLLDFGLETYQSGVDGSAKWGADEQVDGVVSWEVFAELAALAVAEGGQFWVGHVVVFNSEVMIGLLVVFG